LWAEADARIERHRKADATVVVTDADGKPLSGAEVQVEQVRHAFLFGCNIFAWGRVGDEAAEAAYRKQFAEVFNFATLPFYWWSYESRSGQPIHERTEQVARWCQEQHIACKGHPLAWNYGEPRWLPDDSQQVLDLQLGRIADCASRFSGQIDIWDVVNEATHFDRADCSARAPKLTAAWAQTGQEEFVRRCFQQARKASPKATLLINDYRVDPAYAALIEKLVGPDGKPLYDVIGIQSHQHGGVWSNRKIWETCERFSRYGVPLHFTETTIVSGKPGWELAQRGENWETTSEGEATQAREVERFYTMLFSHPAVEAVTWWDFSDRNAWQRAPAGFLRKDMSAKPAYGTLHRLIKEKWWTRTTARTDGEGKAAFRGTLGQYQITVTANGRTTTPQAMEVRRGHANHLAICVKR
jgi:GH35 family endo-1,4-beta-xylanase